MKRMTAFEWKKVFWRTGGRVAVLVLLAVLGITCYFATNVSRVNENGEVEKGAEAVAVLRAKKKEWSGPLDEEKLRLVIRENQRIMATPEYQSEDFEQNDIAFSWRQGFSDIRELMNKAFARDFQEYDYHRADGVTEEEAEDFYENRVRLLEEWLEGEAKDLFSEKEKDWLISRYEQLPVPLFYDYHTGWSQLLEYLPTIVMLAVLVLGYLVSGIFSNEFVWKAEEIYFASVHGRNYGVKAKIKAGLGIITVVYFSLVFLYTAVVLGYLGADGWQCQIQVASRFWKSFYNLTVGQAYGLAVLGGYIGCLFISLLSMWISAKTKSTVLAVMVPVLLIFVPSFLSNLPGCAAAKIIALLPDQLLQLGLAMNYFNLYAVGGRIFGAVPILLVLYTVLSLALLPALYREFACRAGKIKRSEKKPGVKRSVREQVR